MSSTLLLLAQLNISFYMLLVSWSCKLGSADLTYWTWKYTCVPLFGHHLRLHNWVTIWVLAVVIKNVPSSLLMLFHKSFGGHPFWKTGFQKCMHEVYILRWTKCALVILCGFLSLCIKNWNVNYSNQKHCRDIPDQGCWKSCVRAFQLFKNTKQLLYYI